MDGFDFGCPALISICAEGKWRKAGKEVWMEGNEIYLERLSGQQILARTHM